MKCCQSTESGTERAIRCARLLTRKRVAHIGNSKFDAVRVIALKLDNAARRLEMKFVDASESEFIVSLPISAAVDLGLFIDDATRFMTQLKERRQRSAGQ